MFNRAAARWYFAAQGLAGAGWWVAVFTLPAIREATLGSLNPAFVAALDLPLFVAASLLTALGVRWALWVAVPWTVVVAVCMVVYSTATGLAGWGTIAMIAAAAGSIGAGLLLWRGRMPTEWLLIGPFAFREAAASRTRKHVARTARQIVLFWGLFLVVGPCVIALAEANWGLRIALPHSISLSVTVSGIVLLVAASALGVWSAFAMSTRGEGTPLPSASASRLVISGPYRWVRNPMAVAGITQGVAVGLIAGSWLVVGYALAGSLIWNWLIRPQEEAELKARFGDEFIAYRNLVSCWIPRRVPPATRSF